VRHGLHGVVAQIRDREGGSHRRPSGNRVAASRTDAETGQLRVCDASRRRDERQQRG
jgi:hypothetical protein